LALSANNPDLERSRKPNFFIFWGFKSAKRADDTTHTSRRYSGIGNATTSQDRWKTSYQKVQVEFTSKVHRHHP
jgi:hypothetical protein